MGSSQGDEPETRALRRNVNVATKMNVATIRNVLLLALGLTLALGAGKWMDGQTFSA